MEFESYEEAKNEIQKFVESARKLGGKFKKTRKLFEYAGFAVSNYGSIEYFYVGFNNKEVKPQVGIIYTCGAREEYSKTEWNAFQKVLIECYKNKTEFLKPIYDAIKSKGISSEEEKGKIFYDFLSSKTYITNYIQGGHNE